MVLRSHRMRDFSPIVIWTRRWVYSIVYPSCFTIRGPGATSSTTSRPCWRQSVYSRLAGYEDVNDAHRLSVDPTMRRITGKNINNKKAASANTMGRFETKMLSVEDNLKGPFGSQWPMGGKSAAENNSSTHHFGYGQFSQSGPRRARSLCLQRAFRMHLLPSPVLFQPVRRLRRFTASARQRAQCGSLEGAAGTNRGSLREENKSASTFGVMPPSPSQRFMNTWRRRAFCMPSGFPPTRCFKKRSNTC